MKPNPKDYKSITSYRLAQAEHAAAADFTRRLRLFLLAACLTVLAVLALIAWPGPALAVVCVGVPLAVLVKVFLDLRHEAREFNEEHDLP